MNGYIALYKNKKIEVRASTMLDAQTQAAAQFGVKPRKAYMVSVYLCERADGSAVEQVIT